MDEPLVCVLESAELVTGAAVRRIAVAGADLLLVRLADSRVAAFAASCPHQRTDLGTAAFCDGRVRCPLHLYEYDLDSGENVVPTRDLDPAALRKAAPGYLRVHPVEEHDGWIWVGEEPKPPPPSYVPPTEAARRQPTEPGDVVRVRAGTTFELRLPAAHRPGFVWRVETSGPLLGVVGRRAEGGEHVVRLVARGAGRATVRCLYARPWDRDLAEDRTYEVVVDGYS